MSLLSVLLVTIVGSITSAWSYDRFQARRALESRDYSLFFALITITLAWWVLRSVWRMVFGTKKAAPA